MAGVILTDTALRCSPLGWHLTDAESWWRRGSSEEQPCSFFWHQPNHPVQPPFFCSEQKQGRVRLRKKKVESKTTPSLCHLVNKGLRYTGFEIHGHKWDGFGFSVAQTSKPAKPLCELQHLPWQEGVRDEVPAQTGDIQPASAQGYPMAWPCRATATSSRAEKAPSFTSGCTTQRIEELSRAR